MSTARDKSNTMVNFHANFRNMLLYIGGMAIKEQGCPMNSKILSTFINFIFEDKKNKAQIFPKFIENRAHIDIIYMKNRSSYGEALKNHDRTLFSHIDLFSDSVKSTYPDYINWFSKFLTINANEAHLKYIWTCLEALNRQASSLE